MAILRHLFLILLTLCITSLTASAFKWQSDLDKALVQAKEEGKPVLAFCFHSYYYQNPNKKREDFLIWDSPIVRKYESDFIAVKLSGESKGEIIEKYSVASFPTILFFDPQGRELYTMRIEKKTSLNSMSFDPFKNEFESISSRDRALKNDPTLKRSNIAKRMKQVIQKIEEFTLVEQQIKKDDSNPKMILMYAKGLRDRAQFDLAEEQFYRLMHDQKLDVAFQNSVKSSYTNMILYQASVSFYDSKYEKCIETMERFIAKNPKNEAIPQARSLLGMALYESGRTAEGQKILKALARNKKSGPFQQHAKNYLNEKSGGRRR